MANRYAIYFAIFPKKFATDLDKYAIGDQVGQSNGSVLGLLSLRNTGTPVRASPTFVVTNSTSFDPIFLT